MGKQPPARRDGEVSKRAAETLLYRNFFRSVGAAVIDSGVKTRQIESTDRRAEEDYTPERGPVR